MTRTPPPTAPPSEEPTGPGQAQSRTATRRAFLRQSLHATICLPALPGLIARHGDVYDPALPLADLHVHTADTLSLERAAALSRERGVRFGIVEHPGPRYTDMVDDAALHRYLDALEPYPVLKGLQPVEPGWRRLFSGDALARVDYILMDALELPEPDGSFLLTWRDETEVPDAQSFMDRSVDFYVRLLEEEELDILASPTYLPKAIRGDYDGLWTERRMRRVIDAAVGNAVAIEINAMYRIPKPAFVARAKAAGAKFTFGTNGRTEDIVGVLDYSVGVARQCGVTADDLYRPAAGAGGAAAG